MFYWKCSYQLLYVLVLYSICRGLCVSFSLVVEKLQERGCGRFEEKGRGEAAAAQWRVAPTRGRGVLPEVQGQAGCRPGREGGG